MDGGISTIYQFYLTNYFRSTVCTYNVGQNICGLFHVETKFLFTINETEPGYYYQKVNIRLASRVAI